MTPTTPAFLPFTRPEIDATTVAEVSRVLSSGWITSGPQTQAFEAQLSTLFDGRPVCAFSNGTATMASGSTTVTVSTGLPLAAPIGLINVTRPLSLGSASRFGVQNSIAGSFDIVFDVAPGSNISLPWSASLETM